MMLKRSLLFAALVASLAGLLAVRGVRTRVWAQGTTQAQGAVNELTSRQGGESHTGKRIK